MASVTKQLSSTTQTPVSQVTPVHDAAWARYVSDILNPPAVWVAPALLIALTYTPSWQEAALWTLVYCTLICAIPAGYIVAMVKLGRIGDIHMRERHERYIPLLIVLIMSLIAWGMLRTQGAPPVFPFLALLGFVQIMIIALVTLRWQISLHAMAITSAVVGIGFLVNLWLAFLLVPLIIIVGAARLQLKRHTPAQIVAGAMVGLFAPVILLGIFGKTLVLVL